MSGFQIMLMAAGLAATLVLIMAAFAGPSTSKAQAKRLEMVRERHSRSSETVAQLQLKRIFAQRQNRMEGLAQRLIPKPALLRRRLERTGRNWTLGQYAIASIVLAVIVFLGLTFKGVPWILAISLGVFVGIGLPHLVISKLIGRRVDKFTSRFPDAIELMVRGLRSGLPISETMGIVATEIADPVGIEFRAVTDKMKLGRTMEAALQETADNLAETLSNLAEVLRKRAGMKLKIRAMSSESKASAYIIGALPFIVFGLIWFINGQYMQNFFVDTRLMIAGGVGMVWMSIGAFIIAKMINFEI